MDLTEDPAPDLVIEIDVTSSSQNRLQVYAELGVTEVWIYDGEALVIQQLKDGTYIASQTSQFFLKFRFQKFLDFCNGQKQWIIWNW